AARIDLRAHVVKTLLEGLEMAAGVAIEIEPHRVEVPQAAVDCKIAAPVARISPERHAASGVDLGHHIRTAAKRWGERGFLEAFGIHGMPWQDRHEAENERQFAVSVAGEIEADGALGDSRRRRDLQVIRAIVRAAVITQ